MLSTRVQAEPFDTAAEIAALSAGRTDIGAVVTFTGFVRDLSHGVPVEAMTLDHYPAMTTKALAAIAAEAAARWPLQGGTVIHRHGRLLPGDPIVLVAVASAHRAAAFEAAAFLMDWLKTKAPFWKLEEAGGQARWVEAQAGDDAAAARWS
ncbi:molybdenum cofactor biosynthesis protein MoaE [Polymorphobacter arshaanensis]|uniref:Molybdopterin synthase catalytic subunit n=1 Tax=Glacieibacterium arshaanense TaxID=2511025 RepID=A0A4Y9ETB4_9SPHN|nr:molybdenum cofactor biosynthesis protein MoaE [Polymorphobacter arshaanensis]TFU06479.1 molybdenum cofactor biosynthesis protein MoaE [Polymorphobacter arshaanensis]